MDTIQTYLGKWWEMQISVISLSKFWENVGERRERNDVTEGREKKEFRWCGCWNMCPIF